ncbi:MAG: 1-aminocyclopropane-1-carboxylate deaminase/D-cysteine desulfhydrase [Tenacibaculum sp.]
MFNCTTEVKNQQVHLAVLKQKQIELFVKREDKNCTLASGNKFRKLKYNILKAQELQYDTLVTFGGAYSNHIVATAVAGNYLGFKTIGIIRGKELAKALKLNPSLQLATDNNMQLKFISREAYRNKNSEKFVQQLQEEFGKFYLLPEGGTNDLAIKGCEEILSAEDEIFDYICCSVGTGGTLLGLINSAKGKQKVLGFLALKVNFLKGEIKKLSQKRHNCHLQTPYHFGGFAKFNSKLITFINKFKQQTGIPLDPIYTGKMLYGILEMISEDKFPPKSKILAIHSGGLQGIKGANNKLKNQGLPLIDV